MMKPETEQLIGEIMRAVVETAIPLDWKSDSPLPGVGDRKSFYRGPGTDFFEIDEYQPGDDVRTINWATTAQTGGRIVYKTVYQEQKDVKVFGLVDVSDSMDFGTKRCTKRHLAAEILASVMHSADKTRDKVGLTVFSRSGVEDELPARFVATNLYPAMVSALETRATKSPIKTGDGLAKALSGLPLSRSLVVIISDCNWSKKDWDELANASLLHDIIVVYVQDIRERELPVVPGSRAATGACALVGATGGAAAGFFFGNLLGAVIGGLIGLTIGVLLGMKAGSGCHYTLQDADGNRQSVWNDPKARKVYAANFKRREAAVLAGLEARHCVPLVVSTEEGEAAYQKILAIFAGHA